MYYKGLQDTRDALNKLIDEVIDRIDDCQTEIEHIEIKRMARRMTNEDYELREALVNMVYRMERDMETLNRIEDMLFDLI